MEHPTYHCKVDDCGCYPHDFLGQLHDFQALLESCVLLFWGISLALIEVLQLQAKGSIGSLAGVRCKNATCHVDRGISMGFIYIYTHIILYNFIYIFIYIYICNVCVYI